MEQQILSQGTVLGDRFEIESLAGSGDLGEVYKATDKELNKPVALRVITSALLAPEQIDDLRLRIKEASGLVNQNIRATFGMGIQDDGSAFIATEWIAGQNLRALLTKRQEEGKRFSFKGAYNILGHICNALTHVHGKTVHGTLSPRAIGVTESGRIKVGDFGLTALRLRNVASGKGDKLEATFWAPEVTRDFANTTSAADIYSLGALFYELIIGVPPTRPLKAPSLLGFSKAVDAVIARCMAADPKQRYKTAASVKTDIAALVETHITHNSQIGTDDNLGIDVEFDLSDMDENTTEPPGGSMLGAPGLPPPPTGETGALPAGRASTIDLGAVISGIGTSEAARWMVQKGKFDHGPFTDRELVQMMLMGDVLGKHQLLNMDTGVRKKVKAWNHFEEYLERYRQRKKKEDEEAAKIRTEKIEKRGSAFKFVVALGILAFVGLAVGGYFLSRKLREETVYSPEEMVAAFESGEIKLKTGGNLIDKKRRGRRRGGGGGGGQVDGMSYEEAMNMGVNLGGLNSSGAQKTLTPGDITRIMDRNVRRFLPCMGGQSVKRVDMEIAISGDGRVMGVSVKQGGAGLKKCVTSKVRSIKFPGSTAPRTAASWYFELY